MRRLNRLLVAGGSLIALSVLVGGCRSMPDVEWGPLRAPTENSYDVQDDGVLSLAYLGKGESYSEGHC
jgi:hypothetical protein